MEEGSILNYFRSMTTRLWDGGSETTMRRHCGGGEGERQSWMKREEETR
jgi:hypothetical protein